MAPVIAYIYSTQAGFYEILAGHLIKETQPAPIDPEAIPAAMRQPANPVPPQPQAPVNQVPPQPQAPANPVPPQPQAPVDPIPQEVPPQPPVQPQDPEDKQ